jgi:hypothetical protein
MRTQRKKTPIGSSKNQKATRMQVGDVAVQKRNDCGKVVRKNSVPLGQINVSLLAGQSGEAAAETLDGAEGNDNLLATINVGVKHTENVCEVLLVLDDKSLKKKKKKNAAIKNVDRSRWRGLIGKVEDYHSTVVIGSLLVWRPRKYSIHEGFRSSRPTSNRGLCSPNRCQSS